MKLYNLSILRNVTSYEVILFSSLQMHVSDCFMPRVKKIRQKADGGKIVVKLNVRISYVPSKN